MRCFSNYVNYSHKKKFKKPRFLWVLSIYLSPRSQCDWGVCRSKSKTIEHTKQPAFVKPSVTIVYNMESFGGSRNSRRYFERNLHLNVSWIHPSFVNDITPFSHAKQQKSTIASFLRAQAVSKRPKGGVEIWMVGGNRRGVTPILHSRTGVSKW